MANETDNTQPQTVLGQNIISKKREKCIPVYVV